MPSFPNPAGRRLLRTLAGLCASVLVLAACGGSSQIDPFQPVRILSFGDEASVITTSGRKYTVNAVDGNGNLACETYPIWVQVLSVSFGPRFPQCNPGGGAAPNLIYATAGAKAADVLAQVNAHLAADSFGSKDLATIYIGLHDVIEIYAQYPTLTVDQLVAQAEQRGTVVAQAVNAVANAGGRVLIVTLPNVANTPWGVAQESVTTGRRAVLTRLTERFNAAMRVGLLNDSGRQIGLVDAESLIQYRVSYPSSLGLTNVTQGACDLAAGTPLIQCTTGTLKKNADGTALATATTWLWADDTQWSPVGHSQIGSIATNRARNNPF